MCVQVRERLYLSIGLLLMLSSGLTIAITSEESLSNFETVHTSNAAILNRLGLTPLQIPDGHHKKRLAGPEPPKLSLQTRHQPYSRRHGHRDSHIYIVKLPANPPYYTLTKPHKFVNDDKITKTGLNFPVGFEANGKPAKVYHWNLPIVKKLTEKKRTQLNQLKIDQTRKDLEHIKMQEQTSSIKSMLDKMYPLNITTKNYEYHAIGDNDELQLRQKTSTKHVRNNDRILTYSDNDSVKFKLMKKSDNEIAIKAYRLDDLSMRKIHLTNELHGLRNSIPKIKRHRKKAAMSYYAPISSKIGSNNIHKNFSGNGKPKAFYIMEKSRKPVYYHPLLP